MKIDIISWLKKDLGYNIFFRTQSEKEDIGKFGPVSIIIGEYSGKR